MLIDFPQAGKMAENCHTNIQEVGLVYQESQKYKVWLVRLQV